MRTYKRYRRYGTVLALTSAIVCLIILEPPESLAQIKGRIVDVRTQLPLPQAEVMVYHKNGEVYRKVHCASDGSFVIFPTRGRSTLIVLCTNYLVYTSEFRYRRKCIEYGDVYLLPIRQTIHVLKKMQMVSISFINDDPAVHRRETQTLPGLKNCCKHKICGKPNSKTI